MAEELDTYEHCPQCRNIADDKHCVKPGCPWWRCFICRIIFNKAGASMPIRGEAA